MEDLGRTRKQRLAWWAVAGYCLLILVGSSIPGHKMPEGTPSDKVLHTIEYIVLGSLLMYALLLNTRWALPVVLLATVALGTLYGASDELHQMITPQRDASLLDVVADAVGSAIGATAVVCVAFVRRRS